MCNITNRGICRKNGLCSCPDDQVLLTQGCAKTCKNGQVVLNGLCSDESSDFPVNKKQKELCQVIEHESSRDFRSCIFPFSLILDGTRETFENCTNVLDLEGKYWCSTKVSHTVVWKDMLDLKIVQGIWLPPWSKALKGEQESIKS